MTVSAMSLDHKTFQMGLSIEGDEESDSITHLLLKGHKNPILKGNGISKY